MNDTSRMPGDIKAATALHLMAFALGAVHYWAFNAMSMGAGRALHRMLEDWPFFAALFGTLALLALAALLRQGWPRWLLLVVWVAWTAEMLRAKWHVYDIPWIVAIGLGLFAVALSFTEEANAWLQRRAHRQRPAAQ